MVINEMLKHIEGMEQTLEDLKFELYSLQDLELTDDVFLSLKNEIEIVNQSESVILDQIKFIKLAISTNIDNHDFSNDVKLKYSLYLESLMCSLSNSVTKHNERLVKFIGTYDKYKWGTIERNEIITSV